MCGAEVNLSLNGKFGATLYHIHEPITKGGAKPVSRDGTAYAPSNVKVSKRVVRKVRSMIPRTAFHMSGSVTDMYEIDDTLCRRFEASKTAF